MCDKISGFMVSRYSLKCILHIFRIFCCADDPFSTQIRGRASSFGIEKYCCCFIGSHVSLSDGLMASLGIAISCCSIYRSNVRSITQIPIYKISRGFISYTYRLHMNIQDVNSQQKTGEIDVKIRKNKFVNIAIEKSY
jgi:hypothetical protein